MKTIAQKVEDYKRGTIRGFKPFVESGLLTAKEVDFIATGSVINFLDQILRCDFNDKGETSQDKWVADAYIESSEK
ncbi:MAG TPA: hypothetical protein P5098_02160 [Candidatus Dojkabacteria bacterium]|nr:hypothetical protein [Candidatus Dojkabacteria bacterium]